MIRVFILVVLLMCGMLVPAQAGAMSQDMFYADTDLIQVHALVESEAGMVPDGVSMIIAQEGARILRPHLPEEMKVEGVAEISADLMDGRTVTVMVHGNIIPDSGTGKENGVLLALCARLFRSGPACEFQLLYPAAPEVIPAGQATDFINTDSAAYAMLKDRIEKILGRAVLRSFAVSGEALPQGPVE